MSNEFITIQHPPYLVSDQRALYIICLELGIDSIYQLHHKKDLMSIDKIAIAGYILKLYTGMSLKQISDLLKIRYAALLHNIRMLEHRIKAHHKCKDAIRVNNIMRII